MRRFTLALGATLLGLSMGCPPDEDLGTKADGGSASEPVVCGDVTCASGQVCCNESCGICTEPGGACTKQYCEGPINDDPCAKVRCAAGTHCEVTEIQCITTPCDPIVQCVSDDVYGCELIDCKPGFTCIEDAAGNGECVPENTGVQCGKNTCAQGDVCCNASCGICTPPDGACIQIACEEEIEQCEGPVIDCAAPPEGCNYEGGGCVGGKWTCGELVCAGAGCELIDCQPGFTCIEDKTGAGECVPEGASSCAATLCPKGTYCDDISGRAECLPLPSCNTVKCGKGQHCELQDVQCVRAPCPPQAVCVDDGVPCGKNTCTGGQECCNASCGICVDPGFACIQIACEDEA